VGIDFLHQRSCPSLATLLYHGHEDDEEPKNHWTDEVRMELNEMLNEMGIEGRSVQGG
jgi:hypothetical protein